MNHTTRLQNLAANPGRFLRAWLVRHLGHADGLAWISFGLLIWFMLQATMLLATQIRGLSSGLVFPLVLLACVLGWFLPRRIRRRRLALLIAIFGGLVIVTAWLGRLNQPLFDLAAAILGLDTLDNRWSEIQATGQTLTNDLFALNQRIIQWGQAALTGQPGFDPVAVTFVWSYGLWLLALWGSWVVEKERHPLLALAPTLIVIAAVTSYRAATPWSMLLLLAQLILLAALNTHRQRQTISSSKQPVQLSLDLSLGVLLVTTLSLGIAALSVDLAAGRLQKLAQSMITWRQSEALVLSLGLEPQRAPESPLQRLQYGGLPRRHLLGTGPELSQREVLRIRAQAVSSSSLNLPALYWRSLTYAHYNGRGWASGNYQETHYEANQPINNAPTSEFHLTLEQQVQVLDPLRLGQVLFTSGDVLQVDHPVRVARRADGDIFGSTLRTAEYTARSSLIYPGEAALRAAATRYPDDIWQTYTQLPPTLPDRVAALAISLSATAATPYDRAVAIETYLRQFPYNLDVSPPPPNRDVVDYFLFDLGEGYCDYMATAMVVMARAAGMPARLAIGYAPSRLGATGEFIISEAEAHSWPEIYFSELGWVPFEPTAGQPPLQRDGSEATWVDAAPAETALARWLSHIRQWRWSTLWQGMALLALGLAGWPIFTAIYRRQRWSRQPPAATIAEIYQRLGRLSQQLNPDLPPGHTPFELSAFTQQLLREFIRGRYSELANNVRTICRLYVQSSYSTIALSEEQRRQAIAAWNQIQRNLWPYLAQRTIQQYLRQFQTRFFKRPPRHA